MRTLAITLILLATLAALSVPPAVAVSSTVVISQVYGGGGNAGAPYRNDYIELFNDGCNTVSLQGWSVQYAVATSSSWTVMQLMGSIPAGKYFLIQCASGGAVGINLPTPDANYSGVSLSGTAGKVALLNVQPALAVNCPSGGGLVDFVGYGATANCFEGVGPAPGPSSNNLQCVLRKNNGCTETDQNATDFLAIAPNPRNSTFPSFLCSCTTPVGAATWGQVRHTYH